MVREISALHRTQGGATYHLERGNLSGRRLWCVSVFPERSRKIPGREIPDFVLRAFLRENQDLLSDPRCCVGTWHSPKSNRTYLDITAALADEEEALALGRRYNQEGIFALETGTFLDAQGDGEPLANWPPENQRLPALPQTERENKPA